MKICIFHIYPPRVTNKWCSGNSCSRRSPLQVYYRQLVWWIIMDLSYRLCKNCLLLQQLHFNQINWWNTESIRICIVPWAPMMLCSLGPFPPAEHSSMIRRHMGTPHLPKETRAQAIYICNWVESNCAGSPVQVHVCVFVNKHTDVWKKKKVNYDLLWYSTKSVWARIYVSFFQDSYNHNEWNSTLAFVCQPSRFQIFKIYSVW